MNVCKSCNQDALVQDAGGYVCTNCGLVCEHHVFKEQSIGSYLFDGSLNTWDCMGSHYVDGYKEDIPVINRIVVDDAYVIFRGLGNAITSKYGSVYIEAACIRRAAESRNITVRTYVEYMLRESNSSPVVLERCYKDLSQQTPGATNPHIILDAIGSQCQLIVTPNMHDMMHCATEQLMRSSKVIACAILLRENNTSVVTKALVQTTGCNLYNIRSVLIDLCACVA